MDREYPIVGLLIGLFYWIWPITAYLQTGNCVRSVIAMGTEILSSAVLLTASRILWRWLKSSN